MRLFYKAMINGNTKYLRMGEHTIWNLHLISAREAATPLLLSGEWSDVDRYLEANNPEARLGFSSEPAFTGSVLNFDTGSLEEGISLNPDGSYEIKSSMGEREGIYLPRESSTVGKLHDRYMKLVARLHNVKDPRKELPEWTPVNVVPRGRMPVIRGYRSAADENFDAERLRILAAYGTADRRCGAWLAGETEPEGAISKQEYRALEREKKRIDAMLAAANVVI